MSNPAHDRRAWCMSAALLLGAGMLAGRSAGDARGPLRPDLASVVERGDRVEEIVSPPARGRELLIAGALAALMLITAASWLRSTGDCCGACGRRRSRPGACMGCGVVPPESAPPGRAVVRHFRGARMRLVRAVRRRPATAAAVAALLLGCAAVRGVVLSPGPPRTATDTEEGARRAWPPDTARIALIGAFVTVAAWGIIWHAAVQGARERRCHACGGPPSDMQPHGTSERCIWCGAEQ